ncbi:MAG: hypothetical protein IKD74_06950 [Clostridia bacterium]|nr:hypothetical protein [Clostridia bacterium]
MVNNNNLNKSLKGGILETLVLTLAPLLFWICTKCVLGTAMIVGCILIIRTLFIKKDNLQQEIGEKVRFSTFAKVGMAIVILATLLVIIFHIPTHRAKVEETHNEPEQTEIVSEEKQEEVSEDDKTEETSKPTADPNGRQVKGTRTFDAHGAYTNPDGSLKDKITATKEANDPTKSAPKAETTTGSKENKIVDNTNAKADEKTEKVIEEARKDDTKKVEDYKNDIVVITTPKAPETTISDNKPANSDKDIKVNNDEVKELPSIESKPEETTVSEKEVEDDKVVEMEKDELAELFKSAKKEENSIVDTNKNETKAEEVKDVETKTEAVKTEEVVEETVVNKEAEGVVEVVSTEETKVEENNTKNVEVVETVEVKSVEAVKVSAIDGYTGTVGSTMQFKISGDDVRIDGLDGIDYSFNNGVLSINTGSEATVLTVEASNSVNTVAFDITINGIVK